MAPVAASSGDARPRVLVVITRGEPGGAQIHVRDLVLGLRDRVEFHVAVGDDGFLADELRAAALPVHIVSDLQREISLRADRRAVGALRRLIRELRPQLVHTHSTKAGLLGRIAARAERIPALHTAHAWSFSDGLSWRRKAMAVPIEALAGRITERFIVVSEADREIAIRYNVGQDSQIRIVHNGVPDSTLRAQLTARAEAVGADESTAAAAPPVLTMVARLAPPKDPLLLLRALSRVEVPFLLRIVGDGPDRPAVEAAIQDLGLSAQVEMLGVRKDVPALLADSDVFTLISAQEGFPLAILEAMRAGLPVVASDVGGVREAVEHGRTGVLIPRGDEAALRVALNRLLGDATLRSGLGAAGRAAYEARFTVEQMLDATVAVYRELLPPSTRMRAGA
jgi:glycosyltransferase involved in cell wall biosynthesis